MDSMKRKDLRVGQHLAWGKPNKWGTVYMSDVVVLSTLPHVTQEAWGDGARTERAGVISDPVTIDGVEYDLSAWVQRKTGTGVLVVGRSQVRLVRLEHLYGPTFEEAEAEHNRLTAIKKAEDAARQQEWAAEKTADEALREEVLGVLGYDVAHPDWNNHRMVVIDTRVIADLLKATGRL